MLLGWTVSAWDAGPGLTLRVRVQLVRRCVNEVGDTHISRAQPRLQNTSRVGIGSEQHLLGTCYVLRPLPSPKEKPS